MNTPESTFCQAFVEQRRATMVRFTYLYAVIGHFLCLALLPRVIASDMVSRILWIHGLSGVASLVMFLLRPSEKVQRQLQIVLLFA